MQERRIPSASRLERKNEANPPAPSGPGPMPSSRYIRGPRAQGRSDHRPSRPQPVRPSSVQDCRELIHVFLALDGLARPSRTVNRVVPSIRLNGLTSSVTLQMGIRLRQNKLGFGRAAWLRRKQTGQPRVAENVKVSTNFLIPVQQTMDSLTLVSSR